jgi:hypothetical protein
MNHQNLDEPFAGVFRYVPSTEVIIFEACKILCSVCLVIMIMNIKYLDPLPRLHCIIKCVTPFEV